MHGGFFKPLNIIYVGSRCPVLVTVNAAVNRSFSAPVVLDVTVFTPAKSMVVVAGISNQGGVSSIFPITAQSFNFGFNHWK